MKVTTFLSTTLTSLLLFHTPLSTAQDDSQIRAYIYNLPVKSACPSDSYTRYAGLAGECTDVSPTVFPASIEFNYVIGLCSYANVTYYYGQGCTSKVHKTVVVENNVISDCLPGVTPKFKAEGNPKKLPGIGSFKFITYGGALCKV